MWVSNTSLLLNLNIQLRHQNHAVMVQCAATLPKAGASSTTIRLPGIRTVHHSTQGETKRGVPGNRPKTGRNRPKGLGVGLAPTAIGLSTAPISIIWRIFPRTTEPKGSKGPTGPETTKGGKNHKSERTNQQ